MSSGGAAADHGSVVPSNEMTIEVWNGVLFDRFLRFTGRADEAPPVSTARSVATSRGWPRSRRRTTRTTSST